MWLLWVIPGYYGLSRVIMSLLVLVFTYTRRQINLYRMLFSRFSWNFVWTICESLGDYRDIFIGKYCIAEKLDHLACNAFQG